MTFGDPDLLTIPDFLRRPVETKRFRQVAQAPRFPKWKLKLKRPKGKRWKNAERVTVHLNDEAKRLGCGRRIVWASVGRKWAHLTDGVTVAKLTVRQFEKARRQS